MCSSSRVRDITRQVVATGANAAEVAAHLVEGLEGPDLRLAFVFADWRLDAAVIAALTWSGLGAPVVGSTTPGVIARGAIPGALTAVALGLYGEGFRVGIGVATELPKSALARGRDAVGRALAALGLTAAELDPDRHVAITLVDGTCGHEEAFCIGSAAAAPRIRFVGGCAASGLDSPGGASTWVNGEVMSDAGVVVLLESDLPFAVVTSAHLVPTSVKTVVTAASGRVIHELDGRKAAPRLRELIAGIGDVLDEPTPAHTFARYIDGVPFVRSIARIEGDDVVLANAIEVGHVLRVMRPGDLIGTTRRDLTLASERVGGTMAAFLAFSCLGRHQEAKARGLASALAEVHDAYPTIGVQTLGEQSGLLLVNHTLTGLAIGQPRERR